MSYLLADLVGSDNKLESLLKALANAGEKTIDMIAEQFDPSMVDQIANAIR
jgi:DNA-binding MurR/RpiR family transcriptional regulator